MATSRTSEVIQHLRRAVLRRDGAGLTDGQLLECYLNRREEAALAALVRRHGPMVWGVCRRALRNHHDAEDAFQATFLVLVKKAASIAAPELLANWLYGVAYQTARKARATAARRAARERQVADMPEPEMEARGPWHDLQPLLDRELSRLPDKYRAPIVLCDLQGKTRKETARQLGCPEGTVAGRLARARVMLAKRLSRQGVVLSGGSLAALLSQNAAPACVPAAVLTSTIKAAGLFATGQAAGAISVKVVGLTEGVLKTMLLSKLRTVTAVLAGMALVLGLAAPGPLTFAQPGANKPAPAAPPRGEPSGKKAVWQVVWTLKHEHPVTLVASGSDWGAAGDEGGNLFLWDAKTGKDRKLTIKGGKGEGLNTSVDRLQFTPDGKHLFAVLHERRSIFRLNLRKADTPSPGLLGEHPVYLGVSADGETWLERYNLGRTLVLRPNPWTKETVQYESIKHEAEIVDAVVSADDKWLAVVTADGTLHLHERESLKETQTIPLKERTINAVQFSADGQRVAVAGNETFAKVYDTTNGKEVATLTGHRGIVFAVAFSPDGKRVVTGGDDNTARVWDATTGRQLVVLEGHTDSVRSVAFTPGGEMLLTGSADKTVKGWRLTK